MNNWQRVAPIGALYFFFSSVMVLVNNIIFTVPLIFTNYQKLIDNPLWILIGSVAILVAFAVIAFLQFYFFSYRLSENSIEIKAGVIFKKHLNLPFTKIQNVKLIAPVYFRPFGFTSVELDTAGSDKNEAKIVALQLPLAQQLKAQILNQTAVSESLNSQQNFDHSSELNTEQGTSRQHPDEQLLNQRSISDLVIHGITNNRIWIFIAFLAPMADNITDYVADFAISAGIDFSEMFSAQTHAWWQLAAYGLSLLIVSYAIVMLLSVIGSIISFYGFTLTKHGENYIRRSGLLTHHEVVMKLPRLQLVIRQQDWLDILIKRINLRFEQTNSTVKQQPGADIRNKIMVPSINPTQFQQLIDDVWPDNQLAEISFSRISKRFIFKYIVVFTLPIHLIIAGLLIHDELFFNLIYAATSMLLISFLIVMRWYRWGYAIDSEYIYIRKGLLGVDFYTFPIHKVQQTKFKQSWFMKRRSLSSLVLVLASGAQSIPFIKATTALALIDRTLHQVESSKRNWM